MNESEQINEVVKLIRENRLDGDDGAYKKFEVAIDEIRNSLGSYSPGKWRVGWRRCVYVLGELFMEKDAGYFINIAKNKIDDDYQKNEVVEFIRSELMWNFFSQNSDYAIEYMEDLTRKYPGNPEFHHTFSHYLNIKGDHEKAVNECRMALKIEPTNNEFLRTCFNREKHYFDSQLLEEKIVEAEKQLISMETFQLYRHNPLFNNAIGAIRDRLNDHMIINKKILKIDSIINEKTEEERRKLIEVLGFFVAILGFIFTNINIALKGLQFTEMLWFMVGMAIIFLIFGISMSYIFRRDKEIFYKEGKFWILIFLFMLMLLGIFLLKK